MCTLTRNVHIKKKKGYRTTARRAAWGYLQTHLLSRHTPLSAHIHRNQSSIPPPLPRPFTPSPPSLAPFRIPLHIIASALSSPHYSRSLLTYYSVKRDLLLSPLSLALLSRSELSLALLLYVSRRRINVTWGGGYMHYHVLCSPLPRSACAVPRRRTTPLPV